MQTNKLILATGSNLYYLEKISPYLLSIVENSNFDHNYLIFLGENKIYMPFKKIKVLNVDVRDVICLNSIFCIQHGEFFRSKELMKNTDENDIIFFTDGDMTLQRALSDEEIGRFKNFKDNDVYVGYNASPTDTLYDEAFRLQIKGNNPKYMGEYLKKIKVYNTGVLAMNKKTWLKLVEEYIIHYPVIDSLFNFYAKQQWLISYIIGTQDYNIIEMGYDMHNHTHYPSPIGTKIDEKGIVTYEDKVVLFKHKWD